MIIWKISEDEGFKSCLKNFHPKNPSNKYTFGVRGAIGDKNRTLHCNRLACAIGRPGKIYNRTLKCMVIAMEIVSWEHTHVPIIVQ